MSSYTVRAKEAALIENRIVRLTLIDSLYSIYVFVGKNRDYILSEKYCTCPHFYYRIFRKKGDDMCYHLQALHLAIAYDKVRSITVDYSTFREILMEIYSMDKSFILRKLLMKGG